MRITHKLILTFLSIAAMIWIVGYFAIYTGQQALQNSIGQSSVSLASKVLDEIDKDIYNKAEIFRFYSSNLELQEAVLKSNREFEKLGDIQAYINKSNQAWISAPQETLTPFMQALIGSHLSEELRKRTAFYEREYGYNVFPEIFITNKYGANIAQTGKTSDYRQDDEEWWQAAKKDGLYIADVKYDQSAGVYSTDIGVSIVDRDGDFIGAMKIIFNVEEVVNIIKETELAAKFESAKFYLINQAGKLIYPAEKLSSLDALIGQLSLYISKGKEEQYFISRWDKRKELFAYAHSRGYRDFMGLGWILIVRYRAAEIFTPITRLTVNIFVISLLMTILAVLIAFLFSRRITASIRRLRDATVEIGKGKLNTSINITSKDEVGQLADSFKKMTDNLKQTTISIAELNKEIVERKIAEEALKHSEGKINAMLQSLVDHMIMVDRDLNIIWANRTARQVFGNDIIGRKCYQVYHNRSQPCEPYPCIALMAFQDEKVHEYDTQVMDREGRKIYFHCTANVALRDKQGKPAAVIEISRDITKRIKAEERLLKAYQELKQAQTELIHSAKVASIGQIAIGVAHEINNPLSVILGETEILLRDKGKDKDIKSSLDIIVEQSERIRTITESLLEFSHKKEPKIEAVNINEVVEKAISLLSYQVEKEKIEIVKELDAELPQSQGDIDQLQEVFLNIMLNAIQAMGKGGRLTIKTYTERIAKQEGNIFKQGEQIIAVEFQDTGEGMDEETLRRVFDPFFTTKEKNTGLGLSICYRMIENHKGIITVYSELSKGSSFIVKLPIQT